MRSQTLSSNVERSRSPSLQNTDESFNSGNNNSSSQSDNSSDEHHSNSKDRSGTTSQLNNASDNESCNSDFRNHSQSGYSSDHESHNSDSRNPSRTASQSSEVSFHKSKNLKSNSKISVDDNSDGDTMLLNTTLENTMENNQSDDNIGAPKPNPKFSLITESDLESDNDMPMSVDSGHDSEDLGQLKSRKKIKKSKKKNMVKSTHYENKSDSENQDEAECFAKKPRKSGIKKTPNSNKNSKKEKDPLLSIRSETQRLIREGRISLPYHQPKQRSLFEFLEKRKSTPSIPLKATSEILRNVCEQFSNAEKEMKEFYKSDSEHSDHETLITAIDQAETTTADDPIVPISAEMDLIDKELNELDRELAKCEETESNKITETIPSSNESVPLNPENNTTDLPEKNINCEEELKSTQEINESNENVPSDSKSTSSAIESSPVEESENNSAIISDSIDFELKLDDSCPESQETDNLDSYPETKQTSNTDLQPSESSAFENTESSKENYYLKRKLDLLSKLNIKLPTMKAPEISEDIEFEITEIVSPLFKNLGGISKLKEKFVKHSLTKAPNKKSSHVNIISTQKDSEGEVTGIVKETLALNLEDSESEFSHPKFSKPGSKHAYFKQKMLTTLISKKEANWNDSQNEKQRNYESDSEEDIEEDEVSHEKLNFEPYHPEEEPDDEDLIEDDIMLEEKERKKNKFIDEEANEVEESGDECLVDDDNEEEDLSEDNDDKNEEDLNEDRDEATSDIFSEEETECNILKESNNEESKEEIMNAGSKNLFKYNITGLDLENKVLGLESISQKCDATDDLSVSQIFGICSGKFSTQPIISKPDSGSTDFYIDSENINDSQNICLTLLDCDEKLEDSIEFNRNELTQSDTSDNEELFVRKRKAIKLQDSDDESVSPEPQAEENQDENSDEEDPELEYDDDDAIRNEEFGDDGEFGYNSEEEVVNHEEKTREFFEDEAELSESEWGSEDENERDLDKLEKEEGDDDDLDTDKLKEELGKIHMRQLLDDDQHDVRLLKEMLLEDGELHSDAKRQRKFQWKNLDGDVLFSKTCNDSDDEAKSDGDDGNEEHWRKMRHEREMFLSRESKTLQTDLDKVDGTFMHLIGNTKVISETVISKNIQKSPNSKPGSSQVTMNKFKCGSFLTRGKLLLNKLTLSIGECKENINGAKNSKNFVFGAISPEKRSTVVTTEAAEKRKFSGKSAGFSKKIKLSMENDKSLGQKGLLAQLAMSD